MSTYTRLLKLGTYYTIGNVLSRALSFFFIPIYTYYLTTSDYGIVSLMGVSVGLISTLFMSPIINGFTRFYYSPDYKNKQKILVFNTYLVIIFQFVIISFLFYLASRYLAGTILDDRSLFSVVKVYAIILFLSPIEAFNLQFVRLIEKAALFVIVSLSRFLLTAGLVIYLLVVVKLTFWALVFGELFGLLFTIAATYPAIRKNFEFVFSPDSLKQPLKYGYPIILTGVSNFLIQSGDRYVLRFLNSVRDVGLYSFGYKFAGIIDMAVSAPLRLSINPLVYQQEDQPEKLKSFLKDTANYFYYFGCLSCLGLSLFGYEILKIMVRRKEFLDSWSIVPIIAFSYIHQGLGNIVGKGIVMAKKSFHISALVVIVALVNIGLNFVFIPLWGILGAAFATLIAFIIWNALYIYYSSKFYNMDFDSVRLGILTVLTAGFYIISLPTARTDSVWIALSIKALIMFVFCGLVYSVFLKNEERRRLKLFLLKIVKTRPSRSIRSRKTRGPHE